MTTRTPRTPLTIEDYRRQGYTVEKTIAAITINALHKGTYGSRAR